MEKQNDNKYLGSEKISKLLFRFSLPCILSLLISSLYNIVDQIFIGNSELGYLGNAATGIVYPITIIAVAFAWCFGDGSAAYLSLCQGRKDTQNAHKAVGNSILITFLISLCFLGLGFLFQNPLLYLFGASDKSISLAHAYYIIILAAIPIYMVENCMNAIIRADGSPGFSMAAVLVGAILNIILDPIFIFVFHWGIEGAAYATIIGQIASLFVSIFYFTRTKTFSLKKESFVIQWQILKSVMKLGVSTFITQMSIVLISLVCNIMLSKYGALSKYGSDIPIAVIGITMKVFSIVINIVVGIILGAQPILGYNYGAKNIKRVKETFKIVLFVTFVTGILATFVFEFFPTFIIQIFGSNDSLYMEFVVLTFRLFLMLVTFTCFIKVCSIFFQAVGEPFKSTIVSLARDIVFFIPLVIFLPHIWQVEGILIAAPIADLLGTIVTVILIVLFFKQLNSISISKEDESFSILPSKGGVILTISRTHGSQGKAIGKEVAKKLNIPFYDKEVTAFIAKESGLDQEFVSRFTDSENLLYDLYLSTSPVKYAIEAQDKVIHNIAQQGSCVLVGRAADYVLRDYPNLVRIFISAPKDYRIQRVMEMYKDSKEKAQKFVEKSDKKRATYYEMISGQKWGSPDHYDFCINSSIGKEKTAQLICDIIKNLSK